MGVFRIIGKVIFAALLLVIIASVAIVIFAAVSFMIGNEPIKTDKITDPCMTSEDRARDIDDLYNKLMSECPSMDDYSERYGIDYEEMHQRYRKMALECGSDFEYACIFNLFIQKIPSFHTDASLMNYESDFRSSYQNCEVILKDEKKAEKYNFWHKVISEGCAECYNDIIEEGSGILQFSYISGKYQLSGSRSDKYRSGEYFLEELDGKKPGEFAYFDSNYNIGYDSGRDMPYLYSIDLWESDDHKYKGRPVSMTLSDASGRLITDEVYINPVMEYIEYNGGVYDIGLDGTFSDEYDAYYDSSNTGETYTNNMIDEFDSMISTSYDVKNDIFYINFQSFFTYYKPEELREYLESRYSITEKSKVIIDLRSNSGGYESMFFEGLYPLLYSSDMMNTLDFDILCSDVTREYEESLSGKVFRLFNGEDIEKISEDGVDYYRDTYTFEATGQREGSDAKVYILTSPYTGSASDVVVWNLKKAGLATIVGRNTGGEMYSPYITTMPVSGLAYYFSAISADDFGHDNSAYGTEPDIYSSLSYEQYMYYYDMLESGEDSESVGGLLKYDQVFITAYDEALKNAA